MKKRIVTAFITGLSMAFFMSLVMTLVNVGANSEIFGIWMKNWLIGAMVSIPLSFILPSIVAKKVNKYLN